MMLQIFAIIIGAIFATYAVKNVLFLEYYLYGWSAAFIGAGILKQIGVL